MKCPGSKCWFLKHARQFLGDWRPRTIVEPFAGSGVVGLSLLSDGYAERLVLAELDERRIAFWKRVFEPDFAGFVEQWAAQALALPFEEQRPFVLTSLEEFKQSDPGMWALVYSRISFSGRMDGGLMKGGDDGRGLLSRWRKDMVPMLRRLYDLRDRIEVRRQGGMKVLRELDGPDHYAFVDPPYSAGENSKGSTLYQNHTLHHLSLFWLMAEWKGRWQMTYDLCWETLGCGRKRYLLHSEYEPWKSMQVMFQKVPMVTGNNKKAYELVVTSRRENVA
jgi:DNA adenine methylase